MNKIKVVMHSKSLGYSGTDRTAQLFVKYLAQDERFEPFIVHRNDGVNERLDAVRQYLDDDHIIEYHWAGQSPNKPHLPAEENLTEILDKIQPDILHVHNSGHEEWPGLRSVAKQAKIVQTNIFGYPDTERWADKVLYISDYIRQRALAQGGVDGPVIYNPIELPIATDKKLSKDALLKRFNLPEDSILLGRVGRPDNFDPISLKAFVEILKTNPHVYYLVVNPCRGWKDAVNELGIIDNVCWIDSIIDDQELSEFYNGLDIYAHARHDGECCPCNIQEAMMHGLPIVSHRSKIYNGQEEILHNAGFVVDIDDYENYAFCLQNLIESEENREQLGKFARRRAMLMFEASCKTSQLIDEYLKILG
jgi:glycosyltransferase involved in cell wall biosynthesis